MIVKIMSAGKSFAGLSTYLTHDAEKAKTAERVAWTHTLNCAHDDVKSAVSEMLWTSRNAELLKQEAGIRAGGRSTENTVKHVSLNWAPDDEPTREHMIEATEEFLRYIKWDEHQTVLVAHQDKHPHVHAMLNTVHPGTGLKLDDSFEQRRAQAWALEYEREHGRIYCEQRLNDISERQDAPTRPAWMAFKENQKEFEREENALRENEPNLISVEDKSKIANFSEWKNLKEIQRHEREAFFAEGKLEFSELRKSTYREVREEFRERWSDYFSAKRDGADPESLAILKAELVADQKAMLAERRDDACKELRETRNGRYRELLDDQRDIRAGLRARQELGFDNALFLELVENRPAEKDMATAFHDAADQATARQADEVSGADAPAFAAWGGRETAGMKSGADTGARIGEGLGFGLISLFESLADGLIASKPAPKPRPRAPEPLGPNPFELAIDETRKRQQREQEEAADEEFRKKQRSYGD